MPNGQDGGRWVDRESLMGMYARSGITLTGEEIRQRRESLEQRTQRRREADRERTEHLQRSFSTIQPGETVHVEQGTYTVNSSFTVGMDWLDPGIFWGENPFTPATPKPKRPKRPVSAIFYPMVNECGY